MLTGNAGYGFDKMINGWNEYNPDKKPEFSPGIDYHIITFYFPEKPIHETKKDLKKDLKNSLSKKEMIILKEMKGNPGITSLKLSEILGINERNTRKYIEKLKQKNLVKRIGSVKGGKWLVTDE